MKRIDYNPDILNCLANLSNDEVFTPPNIVNDMLDLLPKDLWTNPDATFLDPFSKSGVFPREITKRLNEGLKPVIPDTQERINHILSKQVFGIAITELTSLLSRRSVYCCKTANSEKSIATCFSDEQGNIIYKRVSHSFINGKCEFCGANEDTYPNNEKKENYAYQFIHTNKPKNFFKEMKFDVIIGNPPYQLADGSGASTDSAMPIYNKFIEQSIKLQPNYLCMIVPSKWMVGGRGLQSFRDKMMEDTHIKELVDYENSSECFNGLHIDGGVCYFLWDIKYNGKVKYTYITDDGQRITDIHYLKNKYSKYVIRDSRLFPIIEKLSNKDSFSDIVSYTKPFGIRKDIFNNPDKYPELKENVFPNSVRIYGVKGIKGGARRQIGYFPRNLITKNENSIDIYKLFFTTSYSTNAIEPPETIIGEPNDVCTETFLMVGPFETRQQQINCLSYMKTNLFKFLLYHGKGTMQVNKDVFSLIPMQDFSKPWTDEELYKKYNLSDEEIEYIETMIKPME